MSGAAGIAAAKNRRSKTELNTNRPPIVNCKTTGSCPAPQSTSVRAQAQAQPQARSSGPATDSQMQRDLFDQDSLQIKGPMPPAQILVIHEQRLNKLDEKINQRCQVSVDQTAECIDQECYDKVSELELKIHMLEEVIMNLQLTITNVQSFAMETSLAMLKLQNAQSATATATSPTTTIPTPLALSRPVTPVLESEIVPIL